MQTFLVVLWVLVGLAVLGASTVLVRYKLLSTSPWVKEREWFTRRRKFVKYLILLGPIVVYSVISFLVWLWLLSSASTAGASPNGSDSGSNWPTFCFFLVVGLIFIVVSNRDKIKLRQRTAEDDSKLTSEQLKGKMEGLAATEKQQIKDREERVKKVWKGSQTWITTAVLLVGIKFGWPEAWEYITHHPISAVPVVGFILFYLGRGESKVARGLVFLGLLLLLGRTGLPVTTLEKIESTTKEIITGKWPSPTASGAGRTATGEWKLCWAKMPDAVGVNPSLREQCNPVISAFNPEKPERLETQYMSLGIPRRSVSVWDPGSTTDGSYWQEHPVGGGRFHLEKNKDGLYQGWCTDSKGERALTWLVRK